MPERSRKICIERGKCAFIVGFSRPYETLDTEGQDVKLRPGYNMTYRSNGFYAQYIRPEFLLSSNAVDFDRYAMTEKDLKIKLEPQAPL